MENYGLSLTSLSNHLSGLIFMDYYSQIILTYFGMGSITVPPLTSWFFGFDSIPLLMLNDEYFYLFGQIQISQKGGQPHSDTSPRYGKYWLIIP